MSLEMAFRIFFVFAILVGLTVAVDDGECAKDSQGECSSKGATLLQKGSMTEQTGTKVAEDNLFEALWDSPARMAGKGWSAGQKVAKRFPAGLDFMIQDVCVDANDSPIVGDPATCSEHRDVREGESMPYIRTDKEGDQRYQGVFSYPMTGTDGNLKVMVVKSMNQAMLNADFQPSWDKTRDGFDLVDTSGPYFSIIRTSDGGCYDQKFSEPSAGSRNNAWILYQKDGRAGGLFHSIRIERLDPATPCSSVSEDTSGNTGSVWSGILTLPFEGGKVLQSIVAHHAAHRDLTRTNNAVERFIFTREYGFTRWEAWVPKKRCTDEHGVDAPLCNPQTMDSFLTGRCNASKHNMRGWQAWGGQDWIRTDCRDSTFYVALNNPVIPVTAEMGRENGLLDVVWPPTLKAAQAKCTCDNPMLGAPQNGYTCDDASQSGHCSADQACLSSSPWHKTGDFSGICGPVCSCGSPGQGMPNNGFTCSDASKNGYCSTDQVCIPSNPWAHTGDFSKICEPLCSCNLNFDPDMYPLGVTASNNGYNCTNGYTAYCASNEYCSGPCAIHDWGCLCHNYPYTLAQTAKRIQPMSPLASRGTGSAASPDALK